MARGAKKETHRRERGVMVRAIVPPLVARKLKEMAVKESRTLSAMIAVLLVRAVDKE